MHRLFAALAGAVIGVAVPALAAETLAPVEVRRIAPQPVARATHELELQLHSFRGTRWTSEEIVTALSGAARLLAQCGIALGTSELRTLEAPRRFHYYETRTSRELLARLPARKPAVFFVEDSRNRPAYDAEAIGLANSASRPELANTVWVAHGARDLPLALAHELAHVLADSGAHSAEPGNLMQTETAPSNTRLNDEQCERMRSQGEANALLRRAR